MKTNYAVTDGVTNGVTFYEKKHRIYMPICIKI